MQGSVDIKGLDELTNDLMTVAARYPDRFGDFLTKEAKDIRKETTKEMKRAVSVNPENRSSLGKAGNYQISPVKGYGRLQEVEISAKSPHFHLIENGHMLTNRRGEPVGRGFVPGYKVMDVAVKREKIVYTKKAEKLVDEVLKGENL